jgi:hypothetical protein
MDKGNVNKHRVKLEGLGRVVETSKWGADKAISRYGKLDQPNTRPKDMSYPQDKIDQRGPDWQDDHPKDWVRGFGKGGREDATGKPNFDRAYRPRGK